MANVQVVIGAKDQASAILQKVARETRQVGGGVKRMAADTQSGTGVMSGAFGRLKTAIGGLVAAYVSYRTIQASVRFAFDAAKASDIQAEAVRGLTRALELSGSAVGPSIEQHKAWASALQSTVNVGDEVTLGLMRQASMLGVSNESLQEATAAAIGLSEATGQDMSTSLRAVQLAMAGNFSQLSRYVPALREATSEEEKLRIVQDLASKGLSQKADRAKTAQGAGERLANSWGDFKEVVGSMLDPLRLIVSSGLAMLVETIQTAVIPALQAIMPSAETVRGVIEKLRVVIITMVTTWEVVLGNLGPIWDAVKAKIALVALGIAEDIRHQFTVVIPAYVTWFGENFTKIIGDAMNLAKTVIVNFATTAADLLTAAWKFAASGGQDGQAAADLALAIGVASAKSLTDGFKAETEPLPDIMARALTDGEQGLQAKIASTVGDIASQYASLMGERLASLGATAPVDFPVDLNFGDGPEELKRQMGTLKATESRLLTRGSGGNPLLDEAKKQTKAAERTAKATEKLTEQPVGTGTVLMLDKVGP